VSRPAEYEKLRCGDVRPVDSGESIPVRKMARDWARKNAVRVTPSTGNVFRDLGFSKEESEHLLVRADLLIQVQKAIRSRRLTQAETAKVLRVTQPRVSDLLRGRIDLFSTDTLIDMLARLGVGVRLVVKPGTGELGCVVAW
jgi:predicted XRE-type DNA-binding protein